MPMGDGSVVCFVLCACVAANAGLVSGYMGLEPFEHVVSKGGATVHMRNAVNCSVL